MAGCGALSHPAMKTEAAHAGAHRLQPNVALDRQDQFIPKA
jgi:hypothetical protein